MISQRNAKTGASFTPLNRQLTLWFLILSLIPLIIVSTISYQQAKETLEKNTK